MPPEAPAAPNPTILTEPPVTPPQTPEQKLYEPAAPAAAPTPTEAPGQPPAKPAEPPKEAPQEKTQQEPKPPTESEKKSEGQEPPKPAPTEYDLKLPDGSPLSPEEVAALTKQAKEAGLTQEQAQGMLRAKDEAVRAFVTRQQQTLAKTSEEWKAACEKDPVIGGERYPENVEHARRGFTAIADLELQQLAQSTGFGNHPAVVRAFAKLGRMMAEDRLVRGQVGPAPSTKSPEERLYGKTTPIDEPMS